MKNNKNNQIANHIELHPQQEELNEHARIAQAYIKTKMLFNSIC